MEKRKQKRYITGLDGLRSLAVIGVIFYHLMPTSVRGGYLGVPVFFVVSGYLITDLLRQEWQKNGKINVKDFYFRRLKRLYPAMIVALIASSAYITLFQRNLLNNLRGVFTSSLLYWNNWWQINHQLSYFDRFGNESPFTHLWSLAVEGQHYLIWPIIFILLMKFVKRKKTLFIFLAVVTVISAILMAILYVPGSDPTRVYYGTDTRLFSIWMGSGLAFIWPSNQLKEKIPKQAKQLLNAMGVLSLVILLVCFFYLEDHFTFTYYGGLFLVSLFAAILVAVTVHPGANFNRLLTNKLFTYIGKRSYGIYLYQIPIMIFYEAKVQTIADHVWRHVFIEILLILIVSELSYQFVEKPLRYFNYRQTWSVLKKQFVSSKWNVQRVLTYVSLAVVLVALYGVITSPVNFVADSQKSFQEQLEANREAANQTKHSQKNEDATDSTKDAPLTEDEQAILDKYDLTEEQYQQAKKLPITAFGDSVMLGSTINLQEVFPQAVVDAEVGRQLYAAPDLLNSLQEQGLLNDTVIFGLGTNGSFTDAQFDSVMQALGDRTVYVVTVRVPTQRWQNEVNASLEKMAEKYKNVTLVDWYGLSNDHEEWFLDDHVHPNDIGRIHYTALLAKNILN
jgi:Predicted acyltransferases